MRAIALGSPQGYGFLPSLLDCAPNGETICPPSWGGSCMRGMGFSTICGVSRGKGWAAFGNPVRSFVACRVYNVCKLDRHRHNSRAKVGKGDAQ